MCPFQIGHSGGNLFTRWTDGQDSLCVSRRAFRTRTCFVDALNIPNYPSEGMCVVSALSSIPHCYLCGDSQFLLNSSSFQGVDVGVGMGTGPLDRGTPV